MDFVELKNAWGEYRNCVREVRGLVGGVSRGGGYDDDNDRYAREDGWGRGGANNFTMFGVGCFFADSLRNAIAVARSRTRHARGGFRPDLYLPPRRRCRHRSGGGGGHISSRLRRGGVGRRMPTTPPLRAMMADRRLSTAADPPRCAADLRWWG